MTEQTSTSPECGNMQLVQARPTTLCVSVPVLSKQTMLTPAANLSFPGSSTCMPLPLSLPAQAPFEYSMTVGTATGAAATMALITVRATSRQGALWVAKCGTASRRKRLL